MSYRIKDYGDDENQQKRLLKPSKTERALVAHGWKNDKVKNLKRVLDGNDGPYIN